MCRRSCGGRHRRPEYSLNFKFVDDPGAPQSVPRGFLCDEDTGVWFGKASGLTALSYRIGWSVPDHCGLFVIGFARKRLALSTALRLPRNVSAKEIRYAMQFSKNDF